MQLATSLSGKVKLDLPATSLAKNGLVRAPASNIWLIYKIKHRYEIAHEVSSIIILKEIDSEGSSHKRPTLNIVLVTAQNFYFRA